jgi:hypothetical protein
MQKNSSKSNKNPAAARTRAPQSPNPPHLAPQPQDQGGSGRALNWHFGSGGWPHKELYEMGHHPGKKCFGCQRSVSRWAGHIRQDTNGQSECSERKGRWSQPSAWRRWWMRPRPWTWKRSTGIDRSVQCGTGLWVSLMLTDGPLGSGLSGINSGYHGIPGSKQRDGNGSPSSSFWGQHFVVCGSGTATTAAVSDTSPSVYNFYFYFGCFQF